VIARCAHQGQSAKSTGVEEQGEVEVLLDDYIDEEGDFNARLTEDILLGYGKISWQKWRDVHEIWRCSAKHNRSATSS
jgi:hypothetical protein